MYESMNALCALSANAFIDSSLHQLDFFLEIFSWRLVIISNTHAPLQLCIVTTNHITIAMKLTVIITIYEATIQSCIVVHAWVLL